MIFSGPIVSRRVAVERVAGAQPAGEDVVEAVGVAGVPDPDQVRALGPALGPVGDPAAELEVHEAHHAQRGGGLHRAAVGVGAGAVGAEHRREPAVGHEPLALAHHAVAGRAGRASAAPSVLSQPWWPSPAISTIGWSVSIGVEVGDRRVVRPRGRPVPPADDGQVGPLPRAARAPGSST